MATVADTVIDRLAGALQGYAKAQRESIDEMREIFSDRRAIPGLTEKESNIRKREQLRKKELESARAGVEAAHKLNGALEDLQESIARGAITTTEDRERVKDAINDSLRHTTEMTDRQRNYLSTLRDMIDRGQDVTRHLPHAAKMLDKIGKQQVELYSKHALIVKQADKLQRSMLDLRNNIEEAVKTTFSMKTAVGLAATGFKMSFENIETSLKHQVPIIDTLSGTIKNAAAAYGVSSRKLMEVQNEYTAAMLSASGGVGGMAGAAHNALEEFGPLRKSLQLMTGNYDDALKLFGSTREALSFAGVRLSSAEYNDMMSKPGGVIENMRTLAAMTNKTAEEIGKMTEGMMKDRQMRFTMLGLDKKQRVNRMNEILQYQTLLVAKGMEAEHAFEAAMSLEKLNAQISPKERYKQAAKIRGIAGAMGIAGGERAMGLSMKPPSKWSDEDKAFMQQFSTNMETKMGAMAGGGISEQMVGGAFKDAMGGDLYEVMMQQSTAGLEAREISQETVTELRKQTDQLAPMQDKVNDIKNVLERVAVWGTDAGVMLAGAAAASIGSILAQTYMMTRYLNIISKANAMGGPGAGGVAGGAGKLAKLGRLAGGAAGVLGAGYAGYEIGGILNTLPEKMGFDSLSTNIVDGIKRITEKSQEDVYQLAMSERKAAREEAIEAMKKSDDPVMQELVAALASQKKLSEEQFKLLQKQTNLQLEANELAAEGNEVRKAAASKRTGTSNKRPNQQG